MKRSTLLPLFLTAAALTGCESAADQQRKPAVTATVLDQSLARCDLQGDTAENYRDRLGKVFAESYTQDLETIHAAGITICLDRDLSRQKQFAGKYYFALYNGQAKTLSLIDNGRLNRTAFSSISLGYSAITGGPYLIDSFAGTVRRNKTSQWMAGYCAKGCSMQNTTEQNVQKRGDILLQPPLK